MADCPASGLYRRPRLLVEIFSGAEALHTRLNEKPSRILGRRRWLRDTEVRYALQGDAEVPRKAAGDAQRKPGLHVFSPAAHKAQQHFFLWFKHAARTVAKQFKAGSKYTRVAVSGKTRTLCFGACRAYICVISRENAALESNSATEDILVLTHFQLLIFS